MIDIQEKVLLAHHTTFRIGGAARYFLAAQSRSELTEALKWAEEKGVGYLIIGGGSNLLVSDFGFDGLVIKIKNSNIKIQNDNEKCKIITDAGVPLAKIILETTRAGYSGAEWGFGIPGTIGGAICGNAGRLGQDISQVVDKVFILDADFKEMVLSREDCNFDYRESRFKRTGEIILGAELIFQKGNSEEIQKTLSEAKEVVKKYPPFPSAGCIFKNYKLKDNDDLLRRHPELAERVRGEDRRWLFN